MFKVKVSSDRCFVATIDMVSGNSQRCICGMIGVIKTVDHSDDAYSLFHMGEDSKLVVLSQTFN